MYLHNCHYLFQSFKYCIFFNHLTINSVYLIYIQKQVKSGADQLYMQQQQQSRPRSQTNEAKYFQKYDVQTTSYHLITSRVDLHLCDDTPMEKGK